MSKRRTRSVKLRRKTRRRSIGTMIYRLVCVLLVLGAGALALTVFFKVKIVNVTGVTRYTAEQIRTTLGAKEGDNLFFWGRTAAKQRLQREYPYIGGVQIRCQIPDTLNVEITECEAFAALDDGKGGAFLISDQGKLLEAVENSSATALLRITGVLAGERKVGETLGASEEESEKALVSVMSEMSAVGLLKNADFINLTDPYDIHIGYLKRFDLRLGTTAELTRKLQFLIQIVNEKLSPSDIGVIDLSDVSRMSFWPETIENVQAAAGRPAMVPEEPVTPIGEAGQALVEDGNPQPDEAQTQDANTPAA